MEGPAMSPLRKRRTAKPRGQATAEVALITTLLIGAGASLVYFFPDTLNATQIYMDSYYFVLSMPIP